MRKQIRIGRWLLVFMALDLNAKVTIDLDDFPEAQDD